jgi:hypothetical protein
MRLDPVKGVEKVFPAAERLSSIVEVTALAWGPLTDEYRSRYGKFVHFIEPVAHDKIGHLLEQFDLVVGQMEQGVLGLSEIESMAAGKPLISGIDRSMYPVDKPPVVFADSPELLIEQLQVLQGDARRLANLAYEGREWVRRNHGYEHHLQLLESAYFGRTGVAQAA